MDFDQAGVTDAVMRVAERLRPGGVQWAMPDKSMSHMLVVWSSMNLETRKCLMASVDAHSKEWRSDDVQCIDGLIAAFEIAIALEEHAKRECAQSYSPDAIFDTYATAAWTSALSMSVHLRRTGVVTEPTLQIVRCQHNEVQVETHLEGGCLSQDDMAYTHPLQQLLQRSVQRVDRGWRRCVESVVHSNAGVGEYVIDSMVVSMTGLHVALSPNQRPPWQVRLYLQLTLPQHLRNAQYGNLVELHKFTKFSVRRSLMCALYASIVCGTVARHVKSPMVDFEIAPLNHAHPTLMRQMAVLAQGGKVMFTKGVGCMEALDHALARTENDDLVGSVSKTRTGGCSQREIVTSLISFTERVFTTCFQINYVPYWLSVAMYDARPQRINSIQHQLFHRDLNAAYKLITEHITSTEWYRIKNMTYTNAHLCVSDLKTACSALGVNAEFRTFSGGRNNGLRQNQYDENIVKSLDSKTLAKVLAMGTVAAACEKLLVVDMGQETRRRQVAALIMRHRFESEEELFTQRRHLFHISVCTCCMKVANCVAPTYVDFDSEVFDFQKVGVFKTCVYGDGISTPTKLYCGVRPTSSTSKSMTDTDRSEVERNIMSTDSSKHADDLVKMGHDGTIASKMRRDAKRAMRQTERVVVCGQEPMFTMDILGKIVRIESNWYALCEFCGNFMTVHSHNRYAGSLCCLHCPRSCQSTQETDTITRNSFRVDDSFPSCSTCRFCNKRVIGERYHSPLDTHLHNAHRIPSERFTTWCRWHSRPWLKTALLHLSTPIILAHLAMGTHPVF